MPQSTAFAFIVVFYVIHFPYLFRWIDLKLAEKGDLLPERPKSAPLPTSALAGEALSKKKGDPALGFAVGYTLVYASLSYAILRLFYG